MQGLRAGDHPGQRVLVAYFSHSGNTRTIARRIAEEIHADTFEIVPVTAYPTDYNAVVAQARRELKERHFPALRATVADIEAYDIVFLGSPNWWNTIAPPVMTFLSTHNLAGKVVVPFITHEGSDLGSSLADLKRLSPGATVISGHSFWGSEVVGASREVSGWLRELGMQSGTVLRAV